MKTHVLLRRRQLLTLAALGGCASTETYVSPLPSRSVAPTPPGPSPAEASPPVAEVTPTPPPKELFPLFDRFPSLAPHLPRAVIGAWPTAVTALPDLAAELGLGSLVVKRDDLSAEPYGGGKPRKLELLLGAAAAHGAKGVVTFGGVGSHHAAATAIYAERLGLACRLMLLPQPPTDEVRRVLMTCLRHGAELELVGSLESAERRAAKLDGWATIAAGGSDVRGNMGLVNAALELAHQIERGELSVPDVLYVAVGTMGTAVGLAIGLALAELPTRIVGVRAASWAAASPQKLKRLYDLTGAWLRERAPSISKLELERLALENRFVGKGYAQPTTAGAAATERLRAFDLRLDATYTAKAMAALLSQAKEHAGKNVLFWHTNSHRPLSDAGDPAKLPRALRGYARATS